LIQNDKVPDKEVLKNALAEANNSIRNYIDAVELPKARKGALVLQNLYDYQEQLLEEIKVIRRVIANVENMPKVNLKRQDSSQFLALQEYRLDIIVQNFSLDSKMFRHSLRLTIAVVFAYLLGFLFDIQNTYWILLTIVVIMRPSYGLTKERSKDRIIGTFIGVAAAIAIVLITDDLVIYAAFAFLSLVFGSALIQQNYKFAAAFITISIIFVYSFINPDAFEVIQYRLIDTIIGTTIAVLANYLLFPSWEINNLKQVLLNALKMNKKYLLATQDLYKDPTKYKLSYSVARKEAFLAISNLNAAFQRLTQDPKSKQKESHLIYEIVTLNQTIVSAVASIGNFISNHKTTPASIEFNVLIKKISNTLQMSFDSLNDAQTNKKVGEETAEDAQDKLQKNYQELSNIRDENIRLGNTKLDTETLHALQEAYLIANHINWLQSLSENLEKATEHYRLAIVKA
jgi:uncharacterized membrane protein YccC